MGITPTPFLLPTPVISHHSIALLTELLQYHKPASSWRSSASHLLSVSRHNLSFGARVFASKIWNSSHQPIPNILPDVMLRRKLLLSVSLSCPLAAPIMSPDSLLLLWRHKNLLLTFLWWSCRWEAVQIRGDSTDLQSSQLGDRHRDVRWLHGSLQDLWPRGPRLHRRCRAETCTHFYR